MPNIVEGEPKRVPSFRDFVRFWRDRKRRTTTEVHDKRPPPVDSDLIELLVARDGLATMVELRDGRRLDVRNIAWGYDFGDEYAHVTTNCSPGLPGLSMDFFYTSEVESVRDETGAVLRSGSVPLITEHRMAEPSGPEQPIIHYGSPSTLKTRQSLMVAADRNWMHAPAFDPRRWLRSSNASSCA